MTWRRRHCIVCAADTEDCDICGCHPSPAELRANVALNSTTSGEEKPRAARTAGARPATDLGERNKTHG